MTSEFVGVVIAVVNKTTTREAVTTEVYTLQQMHAQTVCFVTAQPHVTLLTLLSLCGSMCTLRHLLS